MSTGSEASGSGRSQCSWKCWGFENWRSKLAEPEPFGVDRVPPGDVVRLRLGRNIALPMHTA